MSYDICVLPWFAIRVRSNFERRVFTMLSGLGYEAFTPYYRTRREVRERFVNVDKPVFPGYIFCRLNPEFRLPVLQVPGVVHLVGTQKQPEPIAEDEVESVKRMVDTKLALTPWPFLQVGQKIRIEKGPLAGAVGAIISFNGKCKLVATVTLLQRSVAVELDTGWVEPETESRFRSGTISATPISPRFGDGQSAGRVAQAGRGAIVPVGS